MIIHGDCSRSGALGKGNRDRKKDFCLPAFSYAESAALTTLQGVRGQIASQCEEIHFCNRVIRLGERSLM